MPRVAGPSDTLWALEPACWYRGGGLLSLKGLALEESSADSAVCPEFLAYILILMSTVSSAFSFASYLCFCRGASCLLYRQEAELVPGDASSSVHKSADDFSEAKLCTSCLALASQ